MLLDYSLSDNSAILAGKILKRGISNMEDVLNKICGGDDFIYIACPDFSISLRQRRLILGLPIGGYVRWNEAYRFFPLELDVNSCGVHMVKLPSSFNLENFKVALFSLKNDLDNKKLSINDVILKWNFSRRNHFINIYSDNDGCFFAVFHSSGETILFDWENLHKMFNVKYVNIAGRNLPYIQGDDVDQYFDITKKENKFFFDRHVFIFNKLFGENKYEITYADQHFGMINQGEILMGCSKIKPNTIFPLLTRPFSELILAKTSNTPKEILEATNGFSLVPHGLGMTLPNDVIDIIPSDKEDGYVDVCFSNGSIMVTDTLEYVGVSYRNIDVIPEMSRLIGFEVVGTLKPIAFMKI